VALDQEETFGGQPSRSFDEANFTLEQGKHRSIVLHLVFLFCNNLNYALVCAHMFRSWMEP
jgi:hypothetical protein